jgi:glucose-1-phosphate thymidylyltransferase
VYVVQPEPHGLCDALFRPAPLIHPGEQVLLGLPDTIWTPRNALCSLPDDAISLLLFPVTRPWLFDAVVADEDGHVKEIQVKQRNAISNWIWGAVKMPGSVYHALRTLWLRPERKDEYLGTLLNAWIAQGNTVRGARAGQDYVDVGTLDGYRHAMQLLAKGDSEGDEHERDSRAA